MFDIMQNADIISHLTKEFNEVSRVLVGVKETQIPHILIRTYCISMFLLCVLCAPGLSRLPPGSRGVSGPTVS